MRCRHGVLSTLLRRKLRSRWVNRIAQGLTAGMGEVEILSSVMQNVALDPHLLSFLNSSSVPVSWFLSVNDSGSVVLNCSSLKESPVELLVF